MTSCERCDSTRLLGSRHDFTCKDCGHVQPRESQVIGLHPDSLAAARKAIQAARLRKDGKNSAERHTA